MTAAEAAFTALFPGAFFYQTAVGLGLIPPLLGYFTSVALLALPPLAYAYVDRIRRDRRFFSWMDRLFALFMVYFFFVMSFHFIHGADWTIVKTHVIGLIQSTVVFIIFRLMDFRSGRVRLVLLPCLLGMAAIIFHYSVDGSFYLKQFGLAQDADSVSTYQSFALYFFMTFIALMPSVKSTALRLALYGVSVAALYTNTARSEFMGLLLAIPVLEMARSGRSLPRFLAFAATASVLLLTAPINKSLLDLLPTNRVLELLDLGGSTSWELRHALSDAALKTIAENPILGDYGSYLPGAYAHNLLSAWVDLGVIGFASLALLIVVPVALLAAELVARPRGEVPADFVLAFALGAVTMLLMATAKEFLYLTVAAQAGAYASYRHRRWLRGLKEAS